MNDRASAAPPADFLGPGAESTAEYERQFAMDWKPPDLELADAGAGPAPAPTTSGFGGYGGGGGGGYTDVLGHRTSFSSVRSGASAFTTNAAGRSGNNNNNKAPRQAASGFFAQVKERFGLTRSNSSMDVVPRLNSDGANELDDGSAGGSGFFVPPVFKHKRSESVGANHLRKKASEPRQQQQHAGGFFSTNNNSNRDGLDDAHNPHNLTRSATNIAAAAAAAGGGGRPPPPHASMPHVGAIPSLPGFDPTKRPSRDEIAANYQSLLASGFFGTHAIQSTRFAPPGQNLHRQDNGHANNDTDSDKNNNDNTTNMPSFAQRLIDQDESPHEDASFPPSPDRLPPPPPPNRAAPPPPPPPPPPASSAVEVEMEDTIEPAPAPTPAGIPASDTVVFNPVTPAAAAPAPRSSFSSLYRSAHTTTPSVSTSMPPPPPSTSTTTKGRKLKSAHKPSLAFSSIPYSSTEPGAEPIKSAQRPFRAPPVSIARFSAEAGRPRSFDAAFLEHQQQQNQRGVKRPFTATHNNDSRASFATTDGAGVGRVGRGSFEDRYDYNYDYEHDGVGAGAGIGIGVATTTTPAEEKQESGARKLVKRLRKSASKISIDLGRTISRQSLSLSRPGDGGDSHQQHQQQHLGGSLESPPSRTSTSSSLRESLSWRLGVSSSPGGGGGSSSFFGGNGGGASGGGSTSSTSSSTSNHGFGDSYFSLSSTNSNVEPHHYQHYPFAASAATTAATTTTPTARAVPDPPAREAPPPPTSPPTFALVTASLLSTDPSSAERNRLKKREIRGRRLRRQESGSGSGGSSIYYHHKSPTKSSPLNQPPMVSPPSAAQPSFVAAESSSSSGGGMDWQSSPTKRGRSRSRSRPRRSEASLFMLSSTTSTSTSSSSSPRRMAQQDGDGYGGEAREATVRLLPQRQLFGAGGGQNNNLASSMSNQGEGGSGGGMEGVEFSFHLPGRMRPSGGAAAGSISSGPLAVVPDANRGIPSVPSIPGVFRKSMGGGFGSVRVVRSDAV